MPYKSKAQQRFMHAAAERGEIPKKTVKEYDEKTNFSKLPERVKKSSARDGLLEYLKEAACGKSHGKAKAVKKLKKALGK